MIGDATGNTMAQPVIFIPCDVLEVEESLEIRLGNNTLKIAMRIRGEEFSTREERDRKAAKGLAIHFPGQSSRISRRGQDSDRRTARGTSLPVHV
jgi:hypothetical protein